MSILAKFEEISDQVTDFKESWGEVIDVTEFMTDSTGFFNTNGIGAFTQIYDRADGRYRPVYTNESDLKLIRAMAWLLVEKVPMAQAWVNRLLDYTIGTGFDWTIKADDKRLQKGVQNYVRECLDASKWSSELERESYTREIADGEFLGQLIYESGQCIIATREADELTEPFGKRELEDWLGLDYAPSWTFGIMTKQDLPEIHRGYHLVRSSDGSDWDFVDESKAIFWKRNVRARAKRGFSDFYKPHLYLLRADRVLTNTAEGAATQAAIAYIVEHNSTSTQSRAQDIVTRFSPLTGKVDPLTGLAQRRRRMLPGTRLDVPAGQQYKAGLLGSNNSDIYVQVMEAALRLAGSVHAFPEGMLTGSYSNNNHASSLTAEAPFMQGRFAEQSQRKERMREMILKIIKLGASMNRFKFFGVTDWASLQDRLTVEVIPSRILSRDVLKDTQALALQKQNGWVTDKTAINELGRDIDTETANGLKVQGAEKQPGTEQETGGESGNVSSKIEQETANWQDISRLQWQRNRKAISDVVADYVAGKVSKTVAGVLLRQIGLAQQDIDGLLDEDIQPINESPLTEAERKTLGRPFRTPKGPKKFSVYVKNDKGNVIKVNFGDPKMAIRRDDPGARRNFRARHKCKDPGPRWKARYWSCRFWSRPSVSKLLKESVGDLIPWDGRTFVREAWLLKQNPRLLEVRCPTGKGGGIDNTCPRKTKKNEIIKGIRVEGGELRLDPVTDDEIAQRAGSLARSLTAFSDISTQKVIIRKDGKNSAVKMSRMSGADLFVDKNGDFYEVDTAKTSPEKTYANRLDSDAKSKVFDKVKNDSMDLARSILSKQIRFDKPSHDFATELKSMGLDPRLVVPTDSNSRYVYVQIPGQAKEYKVRFADHRQPTFFGVKGMRPVGGFDTERGVRHDAADISLDPETNLTASDALKAIKERMPKKESINESLPLSGRQKALLELWKDYP